MIKPPHYINISFNWNFNELQIGISHIITSLYVCAIVQVCVCVRVYIWKEKQFHQCLVNKWHLKSQTSANRNQQDDRASLTGLLGNATLWEKYSFQCCHYSCTLSHELLISIIVMIGMRWISTCMVRETLK